MVKRSMIIDGQLLQTSAWYRGMGKYMLQVLHELSVLAPDMLDIHIFFNESLGQFNDRYEIINYLCPNIQQWHTSLPVPTEENISPESYKEELDVFIRRSFKSEDSIFLLGSLFTFDIYAGFPDSCVKALLCYDLTPLLLWKDLGGYFPPQLYMSRFAEIYESDQIYSISETTRLDLIKTFGLAADRVINIDGGYTKLAKRSIKPKSFKVPKKFVLFPTGDLPHKNNKEAIIGFDEYVRRTNSDFRLLITSHFNKSSQKELSRHSDKIIFTNNVKDEELDWLYKNAEAVLFASKYEGLGIPILDAVANEKPVIASRIPVFEEMSQGAFYHFELDDEKTLATAITKALSKKDFDEKKSHYKEIMAKYTWERTGRLLVDSLQEAKVGHIERGDSSRYDGRIAVVSLNPGLNSSHIGRLAEPLYNYLKDDYAEVDFYFDSANKHVKEYQRPTFLDHLEGVRVFDLTRLSPYSYRTYDRVVYLVDDLALGYKLTQVASVLPGLAVCRWQESQGEQLILRRLVEDNQMAVFLPDDDQEELLPQIKGFIKQNWSKVNGNTSAQEDIIRTEKLNSRIARKLLKLKNQKSQL